MRRQGSGASKEAGYQGGHHSPFGKKGFKTMTMTEREPLTSTELDAIDAW